MSSRWEGDVEAFFDYPKSRALTELRRAGHEAPFVPELVNFMIKDPTSKLLRTNCDTLTGFFTGTTPTGIQVAVVAHTYHCLTFPGRIDTAIKEGLYLSGGARIGQDEFEHLLSLEGENVSVFDRKKLRAHGHGGRLQSLEAAVQDPLIVSIFNGASRADAWLSRYHEITRKDIITVNTGNATGGPHSDRSARGYLVSLDGHRGKIVLANPLNRGGYYPILPNKRNVIGGQPVAPNAT